MLDSLLDMSLAEISKPASMMEYPTEDSILMTDPEARVRLSHSTMGLIRSCERRFQKAKLLRSAAPRDESPAMSFGKGFGAGVQHYLVLRSSGIAQGEALDAALWVAWASYYPSLEDERRFQERAISLLIRSVPFLEARLREYDIAEFNGKPASELSFCLNISERYYYVGYVDLILKSKESGRFHVVDIKTTSLRSLDLRPHYKNSGQGIGYSIVLDSVVGQDLATFDVSYWACKLGSAKDSIYIPEWVDMNFPYTIKDRMDWFLTTYLDVNYITALEQMTAYPKRGQSCMSFNRVCNFYHECSETALDQPQVYTPDEIEYDFTFELADLLANHEKRLAEFLIPTSGVPT